MIDVERVELLAKFAGYPGELAAAVERAAGEPMDPGEWGPAEVVRHLIAVEREVWQARLAQLAIEVDVRWTWIEPGLARGFDDAPLDEIVRAFVGARAETVTTIRALDDAGWARFGTHTTYGVLDIAGLLRIAVDHDREHLAGIDPAG